MKKHLYIPGAFCFRNSYWICSFFSTFHEKNSKSGVELILIGGLEKWQLKTERIVFSNLSSKNPAEKIEGIENPWKGMNQFFLVRSDLVSEGRSFVMINRFHRTKTM